MGMQRCSDPFYYLTHERNHESTAQSTHKCLISYRVLEGTYTFLLFQEHQKQRHSSLKRICLERGSLCSGVQCDWLKNNRQ